MSGKSFYQETQSMVGGGMNRQLDYWWAKKSIDIRSSVPAKVLHVDYKRSSVRVKPLIKVFIDRDRVMELPETVDLPLFIVSGNDGKAGITMPVKEGDIGELTYADQDTSDWLSGDGKNIIEKPSETSSRENLSTGGTMYPLSFKVGLYTRQKPLEIDPANVVIFNEKAISIYYPDGKVVTKNDNGSYIMEANGDHKFTNGSSNFSVEGDEILANGATLKDGNIVTANGTDLDAFYQLYLLHTHQGVNGTTGVPL